MTDRRNFLRLMGVSAGGVFVGLTGCDLDTESIEEGAETVAGLFDPEDFIVPGQEIWYASTCMQCPAGCGIHARVREGRVRKLEGNPDSPINAGTLCAMGQAGLQHHFNPDRLQRPMARKDDKLVELGWDEAQSRLGDAFARSRERKGKGFALVTGSVSGHGGALLRTLLEQLGPGARHYAVEAISHESARRANRKAAGIDMPTIDMSKAALVLCVGADFLGTWLSPLHLSAQYARFRKQRPRGALIVVEPKMSVTGGNADWWRPIRPGSEGWLMLGLANLLLREPEFAQRLPESALRDALQRYDVDDVAAQTDVPRGQIERMAKALRERRPSLVLAGGAAESGAQGMRNVEAAWLLNHLLGNLGQTIEAPAAAAHPELAPQPGSSSALRALADALPNLDTVIVAGTNPVYAAPGFLRLRERWAKVANKIVLAPELDETAAAADLLLPVRSALEDWGTHAPELNPQPGMLHVQQPVMQPLYANVPGTADVMLKLLARADDGYAAWDDFHAYLRDAVQELRTEAELVGPRPYKLPALLAPPVFEPATPEDAFSANELDRAFWEATVARGLLQLGSKPAEPIAVRASVPELVPAAAANDYPMTLILSPRTALYDGRHANIPWLQELPDPLTTIVWDSWAELHPETAARLGIAQGDLIEVASAHGRLEVKAMLFPGIHPEAVAIPLGQGHDVGRYAKGVGVNPLSILSPVFDEDSGELALCATRVKLRRIGQTATLVRMAPTDYQHERRIVRTVSAKQVQQTEKG